MPRKHWTVELREKNIREIQKWIQGKELTPAYRKALLKRIMSTMYVTRLKAREYMSLACGDEE